MLQCFLNYKHMYPFSLLLTYRIQLFFSGMKTLVMTISANQVKMKNVIRLKLPKQIILKR